MTHTRDPGRIELRIKQPNQLFDTLDPSPFREQDLSSDAEEYIVESFTELHGRSPSELLVQLEGPCTVTEQEAIPDAIHAHFARRAIHLRVKMRELLRRGFISLWIGLSVLVALFIASQAVVRALGEGSRSTLIRESLLIGGWVAMWKPLEILLYEWWPILADRRIHERISRLPVRIRASA